MASFVVHNLHALRLAAHAVCQLDTMKKFGDYRKPRDRGVPIYHAMLSEGGRAMHRFLGFLSTIICRTVKHISFASSPCFQEDRSMVAQLNRFMALLAPCWLWAQLAMAESLPAGYQTIVVDGDTLVVQMAESLPAGYQTIVVDGDTLVVQVLTAPLPVDDPPGAESADSLSAQKEAMESKGMKKKNKPRGASERLARFGFGVIGGTLIGTWTGTIVANATKDCSSYYADGFTCRDDSLIGGGIGFVVGVIIGLGLAADPPAQAETPSKPDEARRFSVGLIPDARGRFSAAAAVYF